MYDILIFVHFIALAMAMGGGFSNIVAKRQMPKAQPVTYPGFALASGAVGKMATTGLALLWVSGLWMGFSKYGTIWDFPSLLWGKLVLVTLLSAVSASLNMLILRARGAGIPPDGKKIDRHAYTISGLALLIVATAVALFH